MTILSGIPKIFSCIDLVADYYFNNSIKDVERIKHGTSKKKIVRSMKSKLPSEISQFLSCGKNKNRLKVLEMLRCDELVISREGDVGCLLKLKKKYMITYSALKRKQTPKLLDMQEKCYIKTLKTKLSGLLQVIHIFLFYLRHC